ncbi:hypothetical protein [Azospirillum lipoferum]|uniref:hypothetical protein n=1 Tax=Azospirillum lipoferum TaxID=193 RepID=UPI0005C89361|nr:hypothetical protein [Azospirillum lipoferum]
MAVRIILVSTTKDSTSRGDPIRSLTRIAGTIVGRSKRSSRGQVPASATRKSAMRRHPEEVPR